MPILRAVSTLNRVRAFFSLVVGAVLCFGIALSSAFEHPRIAEIAPAFAIGVCLLGLALWMLRRDIAQGRRRSPTK
jgi:hypothetical protein